MNNVEVDIVPLIAANNMFPRTLHTNDRTANLLGVPRSPRIHRPSGLWRSLASDIVP